MINKINSDTRDNALCIEPGLTPEKQTPGIILSDEPSIMRQHLRELMDNFFLHNEDYQYNREVFNTYVSLDMFLRDMKN